MKGATICIGVVLLKCTLVELPEYTKVKVKRVATIISHKEVIKMIDYSKIEKEMNLYGQVQGLMNYFTINNLKEINKRLDSNKALGVDKVSKEEYNSNLEENLNNLINKMKKFKYYPNPVKRVSIPKENGKVRYLGVPSYEDKIVQGLIVEILNNIYEKVFLNCSYGFRPNRNCHLALLDIYNTITNKKINYIVDTDITSFFDNLNQEVLISLMQIVIKDSHFIEYIKKFLKAGILDKKEIIPSDKGTPQGGLISPILANIYLHYVLDLWFEEYIKKQTKGRCYLVRYADDFIMLFEYYDDSIYVYNEVIKRLKIFNLSLHIDKTKIFKFNVKEVTPITFNYLGLNIYNYKDNKNNNIKIGIKTNDKNIQRKYEDIRNYIYDNKDDDINNLCNKINDKLRGYYNYYGFNTNLPWLIDIYTYTLLEVTNLLISKYKYMPTNPYELVSNLSIIKPYISIYI